jgi:hypothetical protein
MDGSCAPIASSKAGFVVASKIAKGIAVGVRSGGHEDSNPQAKSEVWFA